jgi:hypothetical protein
MNNNIIVRPTIVDGIEFYVSPAGEAGMSIRGLAKLCGVERQSIINQVEKINSQRGKQITAKEAEALTGEEIMVDNKPADLLMETTNNARVIRDEACAKIIEYFAFDSIAANKTATFSYRKFARLGIRSWIHQVTGYAQANDLNKLAETMHLLLKEVQDLRVETREYKAIRKQSDSHFPGLNELMEDLAVSEVAALPSGDEDGLFTIAEWLVTRGIMLDKSHLHKLASLSAFTYRTLTQKDPRIVYRKSTQAGKSKKVNGYLEVEFPILSIAMQKLMQQK